MSIDADASFIPRVEQKVNLPVVVTGKAVQHILGEGDVRAASKGGGRAPNIMNQNLIYRGPEPSHATRTISRRSRASLRGAMAAKLPGFARPRILLFESAQEYAFFCLTLVHNDSRAWRRVPAASSLSGSFLECCIAAAEGAALQVWADNDQPQSD